jgi:hypothetical protein
MEGTILGTAPALAPGCPTAILMVGSRLMTDDFNIGI